MTIKQFLNRYVEGYLFMDLKTLSRVKLRKGQKIGGVSYPMINSILAGMELLGGLLQNNTFETTPVAGNTYFNNYWDNYLSTYSKQYLGYGQVFRKLIRHGISHTYLTKTGIWIVSGQPTLHLKIFKDGNEHYMVVDIAKFLSDFIRSYNSLVRPLVWGNLCGAVDKDTMEKRANEMITLYEQESNTELTKINSTSPVPTNQTLLLISNASVVQSSMGTVVTYSGMKNKSPWGI